MKNLLFLFYILSVPFCSGQQTWTTYTTTNSGLVNNYIYSIAIDASGNKWIGTSAGISKFDGTNWTNYDQSNGPFGSITNIPGIDIDAQGNVWFAMHGAGVYKFDGTAWTLFDRYNSGLSENITYSVAIDAVGNKWFGHSTGGVSKFNGTTWTNYATWNSELLNNTVHAIATDPQGNIWFGTDGGVSKFDGANWTNYTTENSGLVTNKIQSIAIDAQGNKWFGTYYGGGVSKFDGTNWTTYSTSNSGLIHNDIWCLHIDGQDNKWFGIAAVGCSQFDNTNWTSYNSTNSGLSGNMVMAITSDNQGNIWFGTQNGVSKLFDASLTTNDANPYETNLNIYPNPASEALHINFSENENMAGTISVFDVSGKMLFSSAVKSNDMKLNINDWSSGIYFLKYFKENKQQTVKFIKK